MFPRLHTKDLQIFNKGITNWPKKSNPQNFTKINKQKKTKIQIAKITQKIVSQNLAIFYVPIIKVI